MYLIQLPTGKTVNVKTLEQALNFDYQEAIANSSGFEISNPFHYSTLDTGDISEEDEFISIDLPDLSELEEIDIEEDISD